MKRLAVLLAAAGFAAGACAQHKVHLGVAIPSADHGFTAGIVWWADEAKTELEKTYPDLKITVRTAASAGEQARQVQDLAAGGIDALVVFPQSSAELAGPVQRAHDRGVYVTVVDRGLADTRAQDAYVAGDNTAFGRVAAEYMAQALGGQGDIVVLRGLATPLDDERMNAFAAVMKRHPGIRVLDARYARWNRDDAYKVMREDLRRFGHVDAVWAADDDMAVGVLKAVDQARRRDVRLVFGGAGAKGIVRILKDGSDPRIQADVSYSPKFIYDAIKLTAEARLKGERLPPRTILPSMLVTKETAKDFYFPDSPY